jgi:ATP-binding cassette, subfamily B, bacterial
MKKYKYPTPPLKLSQLIPTTRRIFTSFAPEISQQKALLISSFTALMVEIVLHLLEPWPLKFIFDSILLRDDRTQPVQLPLLPPLNPLLAITVLAGILLLLTLLRAAMAYLSVVGMTQAATNILTEVRAKLYIHIQRLSLSFHHKSRSGDLLTRVTSDIERLRQVMVMAILPLIAHSLTLLSMIGVMFWMHWELALIAAIIFPIFLVATVRMTKKIGKVVKIQRQQEGEMAATAAESIGSIKIVQALSLHHLLVGDFLTRNRQSQKETVKAQRLTAALERMVELLVGTATALVLWRGVHLVIGDALTAGDLLVFVNYVRIAFKPMRQLAKYTGQIAKATASGERIIEVLDTVPEIRDLRGAMEAPRFRGGVRFDNVSFAYETERGILRNLSFAAEAGQTVALVGQSGGGKSTLASLLLRLYDPLEGSILIDGHDLREYKIDSLRQQISIVLQENTLFAASVRDNIAYGCLGVSDREIEAAARLANAHAFIMDLPQGYDTILAEKGATLSGGQRQRIAIARAAVRQSPIVILDEPTTGLDRENEAAVEEALMRLTQGRTTFWISHNLRAIDRADLILYLEAGKLKESGTHAELMRQRGKYAAMWEMQLTVTS